MFEQRKTTVLKNKHSAMLSVKYVFLIWQETNGGIVILPGTFAFSNFYVFHSTLLSIDIERGEGYISIARDIFK